MFLNGLLYVFINNTLSGEFDARGGVGDGVGGAGGVGRGDERAHPQP